MCRPYIDTNNPQGMQLGRSKNRTPARFEYIISIKILKFWRTELSYAQNKNRDKKMRLLGMDTCTSLNDIMEIMYSKRAGV
jgi:hypothetical protein